MAHLASQQRSRRPPCRPSRRPSRCLVAGMLTVILAWSGVGLVGCNQLAGLRATPIEKIVTNPSQYTNVTVRGQVINRFGVLGKGAYELKDDSGSSVWVLTGSGDMPEMNTTITVKGKVSQGVSLGSKNLAVTISETERL